MSIAFWAQQIWQTLYYYGDKYVKTSCKLHLFSFVAICNWKKFKKGLTKYTVEKLSQPDFEILK